MWIWIIFLLNYEEPDIPVEVEVDDLNFELPPMSVKEWDKIPQPPMVILTKIPMMMAKKERVEFFL